MRTIVTLAEPPIGFHKVEFVIAMPVVVFGWTPPPSWCGVVRVGVVVGVTVTVVGAGNHKGCDHGAALLLEAPFT